MKLQVVFAAAAIVAAGPAMAGNLTRSGCNFATGCPRAQAAKPPNYGVPQPTPAPAYRGPTTSKIYGAPEPPKPESFKPYEPYNQYKPASVFGPEPKKKR